MPPGVVDWEHEPTVQALADGKVAMITEWSGWYKWLADPKTSKISDCLGVAVEPRGPAGRKPALGGFSLGINARSSRDKQAAAWLFIQWLTSKQKARDYIEAGGVPGRRSAYQSQDLKKRFPYFDPLVTSWDKFGNAIYRPRFQEWPTISRVISNTGTEMMRGNISVERGAKMLDEQVYYRDEKRRQEQHHHASDAHGDRDIGFGGAGRGQLGFARTTATTQAGTRNQSHHLGPVHEPSQPPQYPGAELCRDEQQRKKGGSDRR
jgi:hypothetical protein